jgi:hypothetical protein
VCNKSLFLITTFVKHNDKTFLVCLIILSSKFYTKHQWYAKSLWLSVSLSLYFSISLSLSLSLHCRFTRITGWKWFLLSNKKLWIFVNSIHVILKQTTRSVKGSTWNIFLTFFLKNELVKYWKNTISFKEMLSHANQCFLISCNKSSFFVNFFHMITVIK